MFWKPDRFAFPKVDTYRHWDRSPGPFSTELHEQGGSWGQGALWGLDVPRDWEQSQQCLCLCVGICIGLKLDVL